MRKVKNPDNYFNDILDKISDDISRMSEYLLRKISIGKSCHNLTHLPEFSARCYNYYLKSLWEC